MSDAMTFPATVEEYMEQYKVIDGDGIYMSKGSEFVPIFRMNQWFEHYKAQKWTFCSERQPDEAGFYLVTKIQKTGAVQIALGNYSPDFGWSGSGNFKNVIAWYPLPEAPEIDMEVTT